VNYRLTEGKRVRSRGAWAKKAPAPASASVADPISEFAGRAKAAWAQPFRKVYEVDPPECPLLGDSGR